MLREQREQLAKAVVQRRELELGDHPHAREVVEHRPRNRIGSEPREHPRRGTHGALSRREVDYGVPVERFAEERAQRPLARRPGRSQRDDGRLARELTVHSGIRKIDHPAHWRPPAVGAT